MATSRTPKQSSFKWHLPFVTHGGRKARLLGVLHASNTDTPYVVAVTDDNGEEDTELYTEDGKYFGTPSPSDMDLSNDDATSTESILGDEQKEYIRKALGLDD